MSNPNGEAPSVPPASRGPIATSKVTASGPLRPQHRVPILSTSDPTTSRDVIQDAGPVADGASPIDVTPSGLVGASPIQGSDVPPSETVVPIVTRQPRQVNFDAIPALLLSHLVKAFGVKIAVNDLSLAVPPGCLFGLVGPNGAGKTTTLSMVTGLLRPDHGAISVLGRDVWSDPAAAKTLMGVLPDGMRLFDRLTGREMLMLTGQLRGLPDAVTGPRADALLDALGLMDDSHTLVADYSAGMTKKIGLACALVHNPQLLILDEPFESVDPVSGEAIRSILHDFVDRGGTVVMSSHVMELVETLCDAVAVIANGSILALGGIEQVCAGQPLQQRFLELVGVHDVEKGSLSWLGQ